MDFNLPVVDDEHEEEEDVLGANFSRMFPTEASRNSIRNNNYNPFLLGQPKPMYQPTNTWNFTQPPLRFQYSGNRPGEDGESSSPDDESSDQGPRNGDENIGTEMREEGKTGKPQKRKRRHEKIPTIAEQFTFIKDVEWMDWKQEVGRSLLTRKRVNDFEEIFSPTLFLRNDSVEETIDIFQNMTGIGHLPEEELKRKLHQAEQVFDKMKKENDLGMKQIREIADEQLSKYQNIVTQSIRSALSLREKTEKGLEEKRRRMVFRITNGRVPFSKLLLRCSDSLEVICSFLNPRFLICNFSCVCSYFMNFVEKRVKLDFIFRSEYPFFLHPIDRILPKFNVRGIKFCPFRDKMREESFPRFLDSIRLNKDTIRKISIEPFPRVIRKKEYFFGSRWRRRRGGSVGRPPSQSSHPLGVGPVPNYEKIDDSQYLRTDPKVRMKRDLETYENEKIDRVKLQEVVSTCKYVEFLEMVDPPSFDNFPYLKAISTIMFRRYDVSSLQSLRFGFLQPFDSESGLDIDKIAEKREQDSTNSIVSELKRILSFLEEDGNLRGMEFLNLTKKELDENYERRCVEIHKIMTVAHPYLSKLFLKIEKFSNLSEICLPFFDGLQKYSKSLIQNFPRFIITLTKFSTGTGKGWSSPSQNKQKLRMRGIWDNDEKDEDVEVGSETRKRDQFLQMSIEKIGLIEKAMMLTRPRMNEEENSAPPRPPSHHDLSPSWKDTFSVCYDETHTYEIEEIIRWLRVPNICLFMNSELFKGIDDDTSSVVTFDDVGNPSVDGNGATKRGDYIFDVVNFSKLQHLDRVKKFRLHFRKPVDFSGHVGLSNLFASGLRYLSFVISIRPDLEGPTDLGRVLMVPRSCLRLARIHGKFLEKFIMLIVHQKYEVTEENIWNELILLIESDNNSKLRELKICPPSSMRGRYFCFRYYDDVDIELSVREEKVQELIHVLKSKNSGLRRLGLFRGEKFDGIQKEINEILKRRLFSDDIM